LPLGLVRQNPVASPPSPRGRKLLGRKDGRPKGEDEEELKARRFSLVKKRALGILFRKKKETTIPIWERGGGKNLLKANVGRLPAGRGTGARCRISERERSHERPRELKEKKVLFRQKKEKKRRIQEEKSRKGILASARLQKGIKLLRDH